MTTPTHAALSPSKAHRYVRCPGSVRLEAQYPDVSNDAAIDGTHSHTLLQKCIEVGLMPASMFLNETLTDHEGSFTVDAQRASRVQVALDYITSRVAALKAKGIDVRVVTEERVDPKMWVERDDMSGTVDARIEGVTPCEFLEIIDYKDGMGVVVAEGNEQMELYAIGAFNGQTQVTMTIIQPKLAAKGMSPVSSCPVDANHLFERAKVYRDAGAATENPNAPLVPGDVQCKFCKAKGGCPELLKQSAALFAPVSDSQMAGALASFVVPKPVAGSLVDNTITKSPDAMSPVDLAEVLKAAPLARQFFEAAEAEAERRMKLGQRVPGFKLVNGRGSRAWSLPEEQIAEKLMKLGIPKGEVYETKLLSPAKVEKLTWKNRAGEVQSLSKKKLSVIESEYVTHMVGKPTVAPDSDSRPAIVTDASAMFQSIAPPVAPDWMK